jgi:hypothetical protein
LAARRTQPNCWVEGDDLLIRPAKEWEEMPIPHVRDVCVGVRTGRELVVRAVCSGRRCISGEPPVGWNVSLNRITEHCRPVLAAQGQKMQWLLRVVGIAYCVFLTVLLVTKDPAAVIGVEGALPWLLATLLPAAHAISFAVLAVLMLIPRWPAPRWGVVAILAVYGGLTEVVQGFVPPRTPEWGDCLQDLCGIAVGTAVCWGAATLLEWQARRRPEGLLAPDSPDDWRSLETALDSPAGEDKREGAGGV